MKIEIKVINLGGFKFVTNVKRVFNKRKSYWLQMKTDNSEATIKFVVIEVEGNLCRALYRKMTDSQLNLLKAVIKDYEDGLALSANIM